MSGHRAIPSAMCRKCIEKAGCGVTMKILYIYPHPDDESFGPAQVMSHQRRDGHEVYLLTLTRGGATKQRQRYNYSIEEMGDVRYGEMQDVAHVLDLSGMTVLDLPDSGLKEMDPRDIERVVRHEILRLRPDVVATYAVHGISGFHDHLVTHAVVKRVFMELRSDMPVLRRFALVTITEDDAAQMSGPFRLTGSTPVDIDCIVAVDDIDVERARRALDCYVTFGETIEKTGIRDFVSHHAVFELYRETFDPPINDLFDELPE